MTNRFVLGVLMVIVFLPVLLVLTPPILWVLEE